VITAAVYKALLTEGFRANVCKIVPSFSAVDGTIQKSPVSVPSDAQSFVAAKLLLPEGCSQGNQNGRVSMNEASIRHKSKEATLPVDRDNELETPETPGKEVLLLTVNKQVI
jgi:hypothetical protein